MSKPDLARAMALREWALQVLSSSRPGGTATAPPVAARHEWRLVLSIERCAMALCERLGRDRTSWASPIRDVLDAFATRELQRVLLARAELQRLARIAGEIGCRILVLKGGVTAPSETASVTLDDLDVLVAPDHARRLAAALDAEGHDTHINSSARHLDARVGSGSIPIEIHTTIQIDGGPPPDGALANAVPLPGVPGLWRLAPAYHLWHVLEHSVSIHTERRGRLRDLLLTAAAVGDCSAEDLGAVERRIESDELGAPLRKQLEMARAIGEGRAPADRFERLAATSYWAWTTPPVGSLPAWLSPAFGRWLFALSTDSPDRRRLWTEALRPGLDRSKYGFIAAIERRAPRLGAACRIAFRLGRVPLALVLAAPAALAARRAVARTLGERG